MSILLTAGLYRKFLVLALMVGAIAFFAAPPRIAGAATVCCEQCDTNYSSCLASCDISEGCPVKCEETWLLCSASCSIEC